MDKNKLEMLVTSYICKKHEGESWDFKRQWYDKDRDKADLLHDIICMSNLVSDKDGLIIIGVDEENDYSLRDTSNDVNRKNTQEIVKFLRDKRFDGGIRPSVYVEELYINNTHIDVIVVENSSYKPYYLTEKFMGVVAYHIYTRIGDTNTPIDKSADRDKVEKLWKIRFGIDKTIIEKFKTYLRDYKHWMSIDGRQSWYYEFAPEYKLETEDDKNSTAYEYYCFSQLHHCPSYSTIKLMYHTTIMYETKLIHLDGGKLTTAIPTSHIFGFVPYYYYISDSIEYLLDCFYGNKASDDMYTRVAYDNWDQCVPCIGTKEQADVFFEWLTTKTIPQETNRRIPAIPDIIREHNDEDGKPYREQYKSAMIINDMLEGFWAEKNM